MIVLAKIVCNEGMPVRQGIGTDQSTHLTLPVQLADLVHVQCHIIHIQAPLHQPQGVCDSSRQPGKRL